MRRSRNCVMRRAARRLSHPAQVAKPPVHSPPASRSSPGDSSLLYDLYGARGVCRAGRPRPDDRFLARQHRDSSAAPPREMPMTCVLPSRRLSRPITWVLRSARPDRPWDREQPRRAHNRNLPRRFDVPGPGGLDRRRHPRHARQPSPIGGGVHRSVLQP
jgi:hypothetical protein